MDQNIEILNQIATNSPKVEALAATILHILKEIPDGPSIASDANIDRQNGEGIICEAQPPANQQPGECDPVGLEIDLRPCSEPNSQKIEALGKTSSLIPDPADAGSSYTETQEAETGASLGENLQERFREVKDAVEGPPRVPEWPITKYDRDRLYEEVWKTPMGVLARQYGVSVSAIRQACQRLAVPTPPRGFWNRGAAARETFPRPELPQTPVQSRRHASSYSEKERYSMLDQIGRAIASGKTLSSACRDAGIMTKTYRQWRKLLPASVASEKSAGGQASSKGDQASPNSSEIGRSQNVVPGSRPQGSPEGSVTGSNASAHNRLTECGEAGQRPQREIKEGSTSDSEIHSPCTVNPILRVSAKLLRIHDRERLYREVWNKPMSQVAKEYGVSSPTIGRRCRQLHIPTPPPGHRRRLANGSLVQQRPPLPEIQIIEEEKKEWKSNIYSPNEIVRISQRISDDILAGMTQEDACYEAGIAITTYRRWSKLQPQPADSSVLPPRRPLLVCGNSETARGGLHHTAAEIAKLNREIEAALQSGKPLLIALREANISQTTYYRWRRSIT